MNPLVPPEFVLTGVWLWESYGKEIVSGMYSAFKGKVQKQWEKIEWEIAAIKYRDNVYKLYSTMRMLGNPNPILIENIFTDIYILDRPTALKRYNIEEIKKEKYLIQDGNRINALDLVKKEQRLFVLGKPGAGKTTLMKYVTLLSTKGVINKIPIFISLNDWALSKMPLIEYVVHQFDICSFPDAELFITEVLLKKGRAIVLFDGLDEVNEENDKRREVTRQISDFTNKYSNNNFIITCRVAATDYSFEKFPYVEVADFTDEQVETFVSKWFLNDSEKGRRCLDELQKPENKRLYELGKTPVLLNLLCLNFDESLAFPPRRAEIYQEGIDVLLKKWDASRNIKRDEIYKGLSYGRRHQLFSQLAAEYFENGETLFEEAELANKINNIIRMFPSSSSVEPPDGYFVLRAIEAQHGLLVERAHRIHSFSHLTFQEYFSARFIVDHIVDGTLDNMMRHITHKRWREVFLLTASLMANADPFFASFSKISENLISKNNETLRALNWAVTKAKSYRSSNIFVACKYAIDINREIIDIGKRIKFIAERRNPKEGLIGYTSDLTNDHPNWLSDLEPVELEDDEAPDWLKSFESKDDEAPDWLNALKPVESKDDEVPDFLRAAGWGESTEAHNKKASEKDQEELDDSKVADGNIETDLNYRADIALRNLFDAMLERQIAMCEDNVEKVNDYQKTISEWSKLTTIGKDMNLSPLIQDLRTLSFGTNNNDFSTREIREFRKFADDFQSTISKHRNFDFTLEFNESSLESIETLLRACILMFDCLRLSVVSNRKSVENRLIRVLSTNSELTWWSPR